MAVPKREKKSGSPPFLARVLGALRELYGKPRPPALTDPFELILYENVAYLADDEKRDEAFGMLRKHVGLSPEKILGAAASTLSAFGRKGIVAEQTVEKLRTIASIALEDFGGDLSAAVRREPKEAVKALRKFPSIGEPGAEKVLLFSGSARPLSRRDRGSEVPSRPTDRDRARSRGVGVL